MPLKTHNERRRAAASLFFWTANRSMFWAYVVITPVKDQDGRVIGFGKVTRDFTERMKTQSALQKEEIAETRKIEQRLRSSERSLRELSLHLLRTQDQERRRIGRNLHDSLGQSLAVLKMKLDSLSVFCEEPRQLTEDIDQCVHLEDSIVELRTISCLLYPPCWKRWV
jgi:signal transduction histidine kinase